MGEEESISFGDRQYRIGDAESLRELDTSSEVVFSKKATIGGRQYRLILLEKDTTEAAVDEVTQNQFSKVDHSSGKKYEYVAIPTNLLHEAEKMKMLPEDFDGWKWIMPATHSETNIPLREETKELFDSGRLHLEIAARRSELEEQKAKVEPAIAAASKREPEFFDATSSALQFGEPMGGRNLIPTEGGAGGSYFLNDAADKIIAVVKPIDESPFTFNNSKGHACVSNDEYHRVRENIPNLEAVQNEALAYVQAQHSGLASMVPKTIMMVVGSDTFYDISDNFPEELRKGISKEKLCSVQQFVGDSIELQEYLINNDTDKLDQDSFEKANILSWITFENDGHTGNYRVHPLPESDKLGLVKIDNGLSNPEKNTGIFNALASMKNAEQPISEEGKRIIAGIPVDTIADEMRLHGKSEDSINAFKDRISQLKVAAQKKNKDETANISLREIDDIMYKLSRNRKV